MIFLSDGSKCRETRCKSVVGWQREQSDTYLIIASRIQVDDKDICCSGPGLAEEVTLQLFRAFLSTKTEGMGLGLSICRTIVEAHGGKIWVETPVEGGTHFHFTLMHIVSEDHDDG